MVVAGNWIVLHICGWGIFKCEIAGKTFYQKIVLVKLPPVDFLIEGEVRRPHAAYLKFIQKGRNTISFCNASCSLCYENHRVLSDNNSFLEMANFGQRMPPLLHALSVSQHPSIDIDSAV